jgi:hypothetical protein
VGLDRCLGQREEAGDLGVRQATGDLDQDLAFPGGQVGQVGTFALLVGEGAGEVLEQAARSTGGDDRVARVNLADRGEQVGRGSVLEQEPGRAGLDRGERVLVQIERRQHDDSGGLWQRL